MASTEPDPVQQQQDASFALVAENQNMPVPLPHPSEAHMVVPPSMPPNDSNGTVPQPAHGQYLHCKTHPPHALNQEKIDSKQNRKRNKTGSKQRKICTVEIPFNEDIWVKGILPFVGMGHFALMAGVSRRMKEYYLDFGATVENPPKVKNRRRPATSSETFYTNVFSSVACAEYWYSQVNQEKGYGDDACRIIAEAGNLKVLKWAHEKGLPWDKDTCAAAAGKGHFDVLKYVHEHGCPWDELTCSEAVNGGHLDILKYAHENGCPWSTRISMNAATEGHLDIFKYLHENGWSGVCQLRD
jgi:hypothetical protein